MHLPLHPVKKPDGKWTLQLNNRSLYPALYDNISRGFRRAHWVGFCDLPKNVIESDKIEAPHSVSSCVV